MNQGPATLKRLERGEAPDEINLLLTSGEVVILHGHGVNVDEAARTREAAFLILTAALVPGAGSLAA